MLFAYTPIFHIPNSEIWSYVSPNFAIPNWEKSSPPLKSHEKTNKT